MKLFLQLLLVALWGLQVDAVARWQYWVSRWLQWRDGTGMGRGVAEGPVGVAGVAVVEEPIGRRCYNLYVVDGKEVTPICR